MQDFTGIAAKLERAEKNIDYLYVEMVRFFQECENPAVPQNDREVFLEASEYRKNLAIPPRFSVLAGEIIHHLRSCFDHVAWHFSVVTVKDIRKIGFPVFVESPAEDNRRGSYEGKIEGITNPDVRSLIERLQPYHAADPLDDPLWIIHDFDIVDKHKELVVCVATTGVVLPWEMRDILETYQREHPELNPAQVARYLKSDAPTQPCISFRYFGRRGIKSVSEGLIELFKYTHTVMDGFRNI